MPTHIEQELGIAPTTNRIRRWFGRFLPGADRSLDPLTVNYEAWRAISKSVRKWPTYNEAPNYIEVLVSPEDWGDYWGIDTTRKEAGVSTYVKARIVEKGLWVAGEPQVLVFEDETIEMGELEVICQFVEPMSAEELNSLRSSIDHRPSYAQGAKTYLTEGDVSSGHQPRTYVQTTQEYEPLEADDATGADDQDGDVQNVAYVAEEDLVEAPAIDVLDAKVERVDDEDPQYEEPLDVELQDGPALQVPEFLAAEVQALEDSIAEMPVIEMPQMVEAEEPQDEPAKDEAHVADVQEEVPEAQEEPDEVVADVAEADAEESVEESTEEPVEDFAGPVDEPDVVPDDIDLEMSDLSSHERPVIPAPKPAAKVAPASVPKIAFDPKPTPRPAISPRPAPAPMPKPTSTVRFVDERNPGSMYLVGDGSFRLEVHSGDCIGAVRIGDSVPAQVNLRLDADAFPYAETMQCSIVVEGGRWCVVNHAVHGTRLTKADGTRYLLGHPDPCALDQGDLLWLGHERPLRVEY
ncbi:MAG: hypothetical protein Q4A07_05345 [Coriobacteriales bacterium]|nr:hypothetical protein [Coriobacteriales bacterium]